MSESKETPPPPPESFGQSASTKVSKKKVIIGIAVVAAIVVAVVAVLYLAFPNSPLKNAGVSGIYDSTKNPGSYVELRSDGTAFFFSNSYGIPRGYAGTWELRDGNRIYATTNQGAAGYFRIDGNNLIDDTVGEVYVKRG